MRKRGKWERMGKHDRVKEEGKTRKTEREREREKEGRGSKKRIKEKKILCRSEGEKMRIRERMNE